MTKKDTKIENSIVSDHDIGSIMLQKCFEMSLKSPLLFDSTGKNIINKRRPSVALHPNFVDLTSQYE